MKKPWTHIAALAWIGSAFATLLVHAHGRGTFVFAHLDTFDSFRQDLSRTVSAFDFRVAASHLLVLSLFCIINAVLFVHGHAVRKRAGIVLDSPLANATHSLCIGHALLLVTFTLLGFLGLYETWLAWALLALGALSAAWIVRANKENFRREYVFSLQSGRRPSLILLLILPVFGYLLLAAFTAPWEWDEVAYNLYLPKEHIARNSLSYIEEYGPHSAFPMYAEMSYISGMLLGWQHRFPHLFSWAHTGLLALALCTLAGRFGLKSKYATLLVLALLSSQFLLKYTSIAKNDLLACMFQLMALDLFLRWGKQGTGRLLAVSGAYMGMALGTKYTSLFVMPPFLLALAALAWARNRSPRVVIRDLFHFGLPALLLFSPWLMRNIVYCGNPLFPGLTSVLGGGGAYDFLPQHRAVWQEVYAATSFSLDPADYVKLLEGLLYKDVGPWIFLFFPPFLLLFVLEIRHRKRNLHILIFLLAANMLIWLGFQAWFIRYNLFFVMLMVMASVLVLQRISRQGAGTRVMCAAIVACLYVNALGYMVASHSGEGQISRKGVIEYAFAKTDRDAFVAERLPFGPAVIWMNRNLPKGTRVLSSLNQFYYCEQEPILIHPYTEYGGFGALESADAFYDQLRELGIGFVAHRRWDLKTGRLSTYPHCVAFHMQIRRSVEALENDKRLYPLEQFGSIRVYRVMDETEVQQY